MVNFGNMMKQAQQLQKKMSDTQEKLNSIDKIYLTVLKVGNANAYKTSYLCFIRHGLDIF